MWTCVCALYAMFISTGADSITFDLILNSFWDMKMKFSPEFSTYQGEYKYNDWTQSLNLSVMDEKWEEADRFLSMLPLVDVDTLSKEKQLEYVIFKDTLTNYQINSQWGWFTLSPINFLEGIHLYSPVEKAKSNTRGDFENYIVRMFNIPKLVDEVIARMDKAININRPYHKVSVGPTFCEPLEYEYVICMYEGWDISSEDHMDAVPAQIEEMLVDVTDSNFYIPFNKSLDNSVIPEKDRQSLRKRGKEGIAVVLDSFRRLKQYLENTYLQNTRPEPSIRSLWNGVRFYQACLKWHTSQNVSATYVHRLGLQEVDRIYSNMQQILNRLSFNGTVRDFLGSIGKDPRFIIDDADEIIDIYKDLVDNRIKPELHRYFTNIPNVEMIVEKSIYDGTGGAYALATDVNPGKFIINLFRPRENPTFDYMALSLHEAYPGHHMQHSFSMKADIPKYRRFPEYSFYEVPYFMPFHSAYVEGWGLYSEYLGEEMGLYADDYELMGRYSAEMLRACRLVVDTGIHYYNWKLEKAKEYMHNYTAFGPGFIENEIKRYVTWPGQACSYKMGELKILELRKKSEEELGALFDIRKFHSVILENGPMPLYILETVVNDWIAETQKARNGATTVYTETYLSTLLVFLGVLACCL